MIEGAAPGNGTVDGLTRRRIQLPDDRIPVLEAHCELIYESDTPWARRIPYEGYRQKWLATAQPDQFLAAVRRSLSDERTIADLWLDGNTPVAYLWLTFGEFGGFDISFAEVNEIWVASTRRRTGLGFELLNLAESVARANGASVLRWNAGIENVASRGLVTKSGFHPIQILYEKLLVENPLQPYSP